MRAVVQRVVSARVEVDGKIVSEIGQGLLVLVGLLESDTDVDSEFICRKILNMRIFHNDKTGKPWDQNVMQKNYEVLLVSQFTLYGVLKGNKPDFHVAMPPELAKPFYESFLERVRKAYNPDTVKDGVFGAMMQVHLVNDGPVTMNLDSRKTSNVDSDETVGTQKIKGNSRSTSQEMSLLKGPQGKLVMTIQSSSCTSSTVRVKCIGQSKFTSTILPRSACHSMHTALRS